MAERNSPATGEHDLPATGEHKLTYAQSVAYDAGVNGVAVCLYRSTVSVTHSLTADQSVSSAA